MLTVARQNKGAITICNKVYSMLGLDLVWLKRAHTWAEHLVRRLTEEPDCLAAPVFLHKDRRQLLLRKEAVGHMGHVRRVNIHKAWAYQFYSYYQDPQATSEDWTEPAMDRMRWIKLCSGLGCQSDTVSSGLVYTLASTHGGRDDQTQMYCAADL